MPATVNSDYGRVPAVVAFSELLDDLLERAARAKPTSSIEPALQRSDFGDLKSAIATIFPPEAAAEGATDAPSNKNARQFATIETAVRGLFSKLATTPIESPDFVRVWNFFDLLSFLSDDGDCDPALLVWLVEELLDSQTIAGCRIIFDYLESRRERVTTKFFDKKKLVILRTCNELLRRLSRAEDTAFCGRVFIFMFQSFPLGDKSSVNLRGEYHVENVTSYDLTSLVTELAGEKMDVDHDPKSQTKAVSFNGTRDAQDGTMEPVALYPMFWALQESFSQPKSLFDPQNLAPFKLGLEATLKSFRAIQDEQGSRPHKPADNGDASLKRKREGEDGGELSSSFNPKYLTSRDLFELEISDLTFRRNILVQAFIIIEFLLSLSKQAKEKLASIKAPNRSVMYLDQELSDEDVAWAQNMKKTVEDCLRQGSDGPQFHRMVDTVLVRDKNWVRWKAENCQAIDRPAVTPEYFAKAQDELRRMTANKRRRGLPLNSLPLDFMKERNHEEEMNRFKEPERYQLPDLESFRKSIAVDDLEIEMPTSDESKAEAVERKASKQWRALRIAAKTRLSMFDKLNDPDSIEPIFGEPEDPDVETEGNGNAENKDDAPTDQRPLIISGPPGAGKKAIIDRLTQHRAGAFARVQRHTTQKPADDDPDKDNFQFVEKQPFDMMRDGDILLEYTTIDGVDYGTSRRTVEGIITGGRVPLIYMDHEAVQQTRDNGFDARFVLILPPNREALEERLRKAGKDDEALATSLAKGAPYLAEDDAASKAGFDFVLVNDDLDVSSKAFEAFIYGNAEGTGANTDDAGEETMDDEAADAIETGKEDTETKKNDDTAMNDTGMTDEVGEGA